MYCTVQYGQWLRRGRQTSASRAISGPKALANYGFLKEVTLRLDPVLAIWRRGAFGPDKNPHMRPISRAMDTQYKADRPHYPFWIVPARDSMLRSYESCGLILPLDHRFKRRRHRDRLVTQTRQRVIRLGALHGAALCRLHVHSLSSQPDESYGSRDGACGWLSKCFPNARGWASQH